ncbi:MAG: pyrroline-5-carboxylate reductase [Peptoniphilaceae bacterium]|nr:pyrroline-5-carboxylate reductase [Peptoniphilaceae bacterium]MDY6018946.1 pyrroline-5-carboxylate reductase [Anaerococcus sp.]
MKIGIIGIGSMGSIIGHALLKEGYDLILSNRGKNLKEFDSNKVLIKTNVELAKEATYIILAVKPQVYPKVIEEIKPYIKDQVLISIAAGQSLKNLEKLIGDKKIVMTMPNTPAQVGSAMSAICPNKNVSEKEVEIVIKIFESFGKASLISEDLFDGFGAVVGCLPAYVFMFIEAVADAAVLTGIKREDAYKFIGQTVKGSSAMLLESKKHPAVLKDMVTSPKGTTIEGLKILEEKAFRGAIIDAIVASYNKSLKMKEK